MYLSEVYLSKFMRGRGSRPDFVEAVQVLFRQSGVAGVGDALPALTVGSIDDTALVGDEESVARVTMLLAGMAEFDEAAQSASQIDEAVAVTQGAVRIRHHDPDPGVAAR